MRCVNCGTGLFVGLLVFLCSQLATNTVLAQSAARTYVAIPRVVNGHQVFVIQDVTPVPLRTVPANRGINKPPYNSLFDSPSKYITACPSVQSTQTSRSSAGSSTTRLDISYRSSYGGTFGLGMSKNRGGPQWITNPYVEQK